MYICCIRAAYGHVTMGKVYKLNRWSLSPMDGECRKVTSSLVSHFVLFIIPVIFLICTLARNVWRASVLCKHVGQISRP